MALQLREDTEKKDKTTMMTMVHHHRFVKHKFQVKNGYKQTNELFIPFFFVIFFVDFGQRSYENVYLHFFKSLACLALQIETMVKKITQLILPKTNNKLTKICNKPGKEQNHSWPSYNKKVTGLWGCCASWNRFMNKHEQINYLVSLKRLEFLLFGLWVPTIE